jgi:serine/threonine protein kinase
VADQLRPGDPRSVGPYRLTGRLGGGGMGEVFLGRSAGGRLVAVKVIRPELAADPEFRARFRHEVAAARSVNGLYTAPVADAQVDGPMPWLATAYVPGPSLDTAIDEHGPLPARSVLALAAGLAEGLAAIHDAGLVHRDLKPSNVLLATDGPRVIDFGIATGAQATVLTMAGHIIGSPDFMSPEQATGRELGPATDVFSLGAVLTYAATGHAPFLAAETTTLLGLIVNDEPDLSRVPRQVRPVVQWCLAKDAYDRPTPRDLLSRLGETRLWDDWLPDRMLAEIRDTGDRMSPGPLNPAPVNPAPVNPAPLGHGGDTQTMRAPSASVAETRRPAVPERETPARDTVDAPTPPPPGLPRVAGVTAPAPPAPPAHAAPPAAAGPAAAATAAARVTKDGPAEQAGATTRPPARTGRTRDSRGGDPTEPRSPRPPRRVWLPAAAVVVLAAAAGGLWLALGSHPASSSSQPPTASATASTPPAAPSPYRFAATGATAFACSADLASTSGHAKADVVFTNSTKQDVQVYWLNYTGKPALHVTVKPGVSQRIGGNVGDAWEVAGPSGCAGEFVTTGTARIQVKSAYG